MNNVVSPLIYIFGFQYTINNFHVALFSSYKLVLVLISLFCLYHVGYFGCHTEITMYIGYLSPYGLPPRCLWRVQTVISGLLIVSNLTVSSMRCTIQRKCGRFLFPVVLRGILFIDHSLHFHSSSYVISETHGFWKGNVQSTYLLCSNCESKCMRQPSHDKCMS